MKFSLHQIVLVMLLGFCLLIPAVCHAEETQYHTSGVYTYYVLDEQKKEISICAVSSTEKELVIPSELDGYRVSRIGYPEGDHYEEAKKSVAVLTNIWKKL